jgi:hypothetical protein
MLTWCIVLFLVDIVELLEGWMFIGGVDFKRCNVYNDDE